MNVVGGEGGPVGRVVRAVDRPPPPLLLHRIHRHRDHRSPLAFIRRRLLPVGVGVLGEHHHRRRRHHLHENNTDPIMLQYAGTYAPPP